MSSEWIPFHEQKPEIGQFMAIRSKSNEYFLCWYWPGVSKELVTHWAPLPPVLDDSGEVEEFDEETKQLIEKWKSEGSF